MVFLVNSYRYSLIFLILLILLYQFIICQFILTSPLHGDEHHFVKTISQFKELSLERMQDYDEVTTPLVFYIYAAWGNIVGFDLSHLRFLSLIIAFITIIAAHLFFFLNMPDKRYALYSTIVLALNPYIIGFNVYIFTDMVTILGVILLCISILKNNVLLLFFSSFIVIFSRQYGVFIIASCFIFFAFQFYKTRHFNNIKMIIALIVSCIPFLILIYIWKGLSPLSGRSYWINNKPLTYNINYFFTYICMLFLYSLPILLFTWKRLKLNIRLVSIFLLVGLVYFLFPVIPSQVTLEQTKLDTVGLMHKFIRVVFKNNTAENLFFYTSFVCGLILIYHIILTLIEQIRKLNYDFILFADLSILMFLVVMPFSYQVWEKYILLILPLVYVRMLSPFNAAESDSLHKI